jgi:peptidoglycan/LPS O-acetylase OafA/YrhL
MPKPHITQVDYVRAIASLSVALFHMGGKALPVLKYGWLGVEMFFLLSGFIICWAIPNDYTLRWAGKFILKRILRIEPPYIISILLVLAIHFLFVEHYRPDWLNVLSHLGYINNFNQKPYLSPVYWTLGIEFQFYLFVALFFQLIDKKYSPIMLIILCVLPIWVNVSVVGLTTFFPLFTLGIIFFLFKRNIINLRPALTYGAVVTIISFYRIGIIDTSAGLFAVGLLAAPLKSNRVISFFSKISFSLYLTHDIIGSSLVVYMGTKLPKTTMYKGVEFLSGIIVSIIFAYIFYRWVEQPSIKFSKRIRYQNKSHLLVA